MLVQDSHREKYLGIGVVSARVDPDGVTSRYCR